MQSAAATEELAQIILAQCETEAIHTPESIQPHGFLFACNSFKQLTRISQNLVSEFCAQPGLAAADLLGRLIEDCPRKLGGLLSDCFEALADVDAQTAMKRSDTESPFFRNVIECGETQMRVSCFANGTERFFELEPLLPQSPLEAFDCFQKGVELLSNQSDLSSLFQTLAATVRELLCYDRVLIYRFDPDWNGSVVGESRLSTAESFLGLHFPASDIPAQARALYEINTSRLIVDSWYLPAQIISCAGSQPADLTFSKLRSISPAHIQYMRNMAVRASFTVSILVDGRLWGLLTAHHFSEPKYLPQHLRDLTQTLCKVASTKILHIEESQQVQKALFRNSKLRNVAKAFETAALNNSHLNEVLVEKIQNDVLELTSSTGFILGSEKSLLMSGAAPSTEDCAALIDFLKRALGQETVFATDRLSDIYPAAKSFKETVSGCLVVSLPQLDLENDTHTLAVWLRPEFVAELKWAGNPDKSVQLQNGKISPRNSFREFVQKIKNRSSPWSSRDRESAHLFCEQYALYCRALQESKLRFSIAENALKQGKIEATSRILHDIGNALAGAIPKVSQRLVEVDWEEVSSLRRLLEWVRLNSAQFENVLGEGKGNSLANFVQAILESLELRSNSLRADFKSLANSLHHAEHILQLQRLLTPAGAAKLAKTYSLTDLVQNVIDMCSGFLVPYQIAVDTSFEINAFVEIDQTNLMRVFMNLIKNAAESIAKEAPVAPKITISVSRSAQKCVTVSIADNGHGFSRQDETLLQSNSFTSKPGGSGGSGLASCREILASVGSRLNLTSPGLHCGAIAFFELEALPEGKET